jgi:sugar phosphate isomerase/epimerase
MGADMTRRDWLRGTVAGAALAAPAAAENGAAKGPFLFGFNTSTIMGQKLPLVQEVEIAARAGYQGFEPWIRELDAYVKEGGSLEDLGKRIRDHGLRVESSIGFAAWIVDDDVQRRQGLEEAKRAMDMVARIGGKRLAAPPVGATDKSGLDLLKVAERYRQLLDLGLKMGVVPQVEVWGFSKTLSRLGETLLVAVESGSPRACVLADVYHLYKGGSDFATLRLVGAPALQILHMNDYPDKPRATITDADRVYPGDGVAPLPALVRDLRDLGFRGMLSLELFNRDYWKQDPLHVARTGLEKMKAVVQRGLEMPR